MAPPRALVVLLLLLSVLVPSLLAGSAPVNNAYDFVIVGCGTAGSIVAAELSATSESVLCINIGSDASAETSALNFYDTFPSSGKIPGVDYFFSTRETTLGGQSQLWPEARVLGGGSSVNGELFQRPSAEDLEGFASASWTYAATLADWKRVESFAAGDPLYHGTSGPIGVVAPAPGVQLAKVRDEMMSQLNLTFNNDSNGPVYTGVSVFPRNFALVNGSVVRQDTWTRFLKPVLSRSNLRVLDKAHVLKVILNPNGKNEVKYFHFGETYSVKAMKEVIVSAGVINSPHLLLLSGIGNCSELAGITCEHNLPGVGKNVHMSAVTSQLAYSPVTSPAPVNGSIIGVYYKSSLFPGNGTNIEMAVTGVAAPGAILYLSALTQHRLNNTGTIRLASDDPWSPPQINFNFFANSLDLVHMAEAFNKSRSILAATAIMSEISPGYAAVPLGASTQDIIAYLVKVMQPDKVVGSCAMHSVVDERLRVIGLDGLRVIDISIIPTALRTHSAKASADLIAMVGSRMIKEDWNL